ncbi:MAG: VacJ family lipoprotein [Deltaproteobacteria bacterium]|nr:VacJ family lipoprotein [Deltaproteobacteria bacterium]
MKLFASQFFVLSVLFFLLPPLELIAQEFSDTDDFEKSASLDSENENFQEDEKAIYDPIEPLNRAIFNFNDTVDIYFLEPVARIYDCILPRPIKTGVDNFFENIRYPQYLVSDLVQLKFDQVLEHSGRFVVNSTVGVLGLIDVAKHLDLPRHEEDFGLALAYHGVPDGIYWVLPFLGPSNIRDTVGLIVDGFLSPLYVINYTSVAARTKNIAMCSSKGLDIVSSRASALEAVKAAKESSVDYYLFSQSAYYQYRTGLLYDGDPPFDDELEVLDEDLESDDHEEEETEETIEEIEEERE